MAYRAPISPGTEHEGNWYVPVMGMAAGAGQGLSRYGSLVDKFMESMRGTSQLPTTENLASYAGGINAGGQGTVAARYAGMPISDMVRMAETDPARAQRVADALTQYPRVTSAEFLKPSMSSSDYVNAGFSGGDIPDKAVLERVMNNGMRDKLLGFGGVVTLPMPGIEQGGRHDILSRLLGIDYPGYVINSPNTGNASQNEQLRQLRY